MEMFKARKSGVTAARNIMGEDLEFDFTEYPDFLHTTYEVTWVGLTEAEARERYRDVVIIQMPPTVKDLDTPNLPLPCAEGTMLYAFSKPELSGFQKLVVDGDSRKVARRPPRRVRREGRLPVPRLPDPPPRGPHHRHARLDERAVPQPGALRPALPAAGRQREPAQPVRRRRDPAAGAEHPGPPLPRAVRAGGRLPAHRAGGPRPPPSAARSTAAPTSSRCARTATTALVAVRKASRRAAVLARSPRRGCSPARTRRPGSTRPETDVGNATVARRARPCPGRG